MKVKVEEQGRQVVVREPELSTESAACESSFVPCVT